jgi:hypothetical protein
MSNKHTPGPWKYGHSGDNFWIAPQWDGRKVALVTWGMGETVAEGRENAALIAAAPELLAALKALVACCETYPAFQKESNPITFGRMDAALAAIAKAEGR